MEQRLIVRGYALALMAVILATLIRWLADPYLGESVPFPTYFVAVAFVGLYGGVGPAVFTLMAGGFLANLLFLPPRGSVTLPGLELWLGLTMFAVAAALIVALTEWLRVRSANLAAIVSTAHEGIVTRNLDGTVTGWNAGAERMYGYARDEMIGASIERLSSPSKSEEIRWIAAEVQAGRPVDALETERIRKDGQRIDVLVSAAPVRDGRGRVTGVATIERDVTERKRVERARRTSEARLQAIIDNSPVVLFIKDLEGRYFLVNNSYVELFDTTPERVLGTTDYDRFPAEAAEVYRRNDRAVVESGTAHKFEETVEANGEVRTFLSTKFPLRDDGGEIYAVCGISTDVTEETRRHEQLVDLDQRKDQFLSMLAHELRNPLAPIANAVQLIRLEGDNLSPRATWAGEVIERQARHLTRMVDDLLDIARFNTGRVQLRREVVDMVGLAQQAVEDLRSRFDAAGVVLSVSLPDEPVLVDADAARVVQVIDNLLDNAAKYTDAGGQAFLTLERGDDTCLLRVRDTGIGISLTDLASVFDLFEQVDESLDRSSGGLGLGLNLVKRMVELHGGAVTACSEGRGRGSEFLVRLPLATTSLHDAPANVAAPVLAAAGRCVLVIEDNPDTAESMEMLLEALGHDVRVATSGKAGLAMATERQPELVLVDLGLPDIDGYEIARLLRERFGESLRLVALTGYGQEEHRRRTREAGFDEHLLKPLSMEALTQALATCPACEDV
jgi:PAS domain S-box-containing protein